MTSRGGKNWSSGSIPLIAPELFGEILSIASDIAIVVSKEGVIQSILINPSQTSFGSLDHWEGQNIRDFLTTESVPKIEARFEKIEAGESPGRAVELNHVDRGNWEFPISYTFHPIASDGVLLMLGRDLRPIAEMQQQLMRVQVALERDYEAQREYDTRFRVLMDKTHDAFAFVSTETGRITDLNSAAAVILGASQDELTSSAFAQEFEGRRRGEFIENLSNVAISEVATVMNLKARRTSENVQISPTIFRAAGERLLLCRMDATNDDGQVIGGEGEMVRAYVDNSADALVFTDQEGLIQSANESFLNMADAAHVTRVKGRILSDFLARGSVDLKVLLENAQRTGHMKMYVTRISTEYGSQVPVEISVTYLNDPTRPSYVFAMRDISRVEAMRSTPPDANEESGRSAMELVGNATLREIVAETTDVVEKMCIETAVELTQNNRVAAAEMLGLSRQSLYVKLRKYGLLSRDPDG